MHSPYGIRATTPAYAKIAQDLKEHASHIGYTFGEGLKEIFDNISAKEEPKWNETLGWRGIRTCTTSVPARLLELPAFIFSSVIKHTLDIYIEHKSKHAPNLERTDQAKIFFDKKHERINRSLSKGSIRRSFAHVLNAPLLIISKIATIAETILKGLINVLGSSFSSKCNLKTGVKQLFCKVPHHLLLLPATIYLTSIKTLYVVLGHVSTWDRN